jgi:hypothetical protein
MWLLPVATGAVVKAVFTVVTYIWREGLVAAYKLLTEIADQAGAMSLPAPVVTCVDDGRMVLGTVACEKAVQ